MTTKTIMVADIQQRLLQLANRVTEERQPRIRVLGPAQLRRALDKLTSTAITPYVPSGLAVARPEPALAAAALSGHTILSPSDVMKFPYSCMGRVEAAPAGTSGYQHAGSGALVGPRLVLTAAHILKQFPLGSWDFRFVPAYYSGTQSKAPDGSPIVWSAFTGLVVMGDPNGNVNYGGFDTVNGWDFAIFETSLRLGDIWGHMGIIWDDDANFYEGRQWTSVGYPSAVEGGEKPNIFHGLEISGVDKDDFGSRELETEEFVDGWGPFPNNPNKWKGWSGGPLFTFYEGQWYIGGVMSGWDLDGPIDLDGVTVFAGGPRLGAVHTEAWEAVAPLPVGNQFGYVTTGNVQHVVYRATDNNVYELFTRPDGWIYNRLTTDRHAAGAPAAYVTAGNVQHVVFRGNDNHIYELFTKNHQWVWNRISQSAGAPGAVSNPFGYVSAGDVQHVVYRGGDGHIYELFTRPDGWTYNRLTDAPRAVGNPHAYMTAGDVQHVIYRGNDNHIYELFTKNHQWVWNRISELAGSPPAGSDPFGYVTVGNVQHVVYRGTDNHIYELFTQPGGWVYNRLTGFALAAGNPRAYVGAGGTVQHVIFRGNDAHIHELFTNANGWNWKILSQEAQSSLAVTDPFGYITDGEVQHVVYGGHDRHVNELSTQNHKWVVNSLTYHL